MCTYVDVATVPLSERESDGTIWNGGGYSIPQCYAETRNGTRCEYNGKYFPGIRYHDVLCRVHYAIADRGGNVKIREVWTDLVSIGQ